MMLINNKAVFIHFPKTGGTYVRTVLNRLATCESISGGHNSNDHYPLRELPEEHRDKMVFATVRNPLDWYVSAWKFLADWRNNGGRFGKNSPNPLAGIENCYHNNFNTFVINVLKKHPGYYSENFKAFFTGPVEVDRWIFTELLTYQLMDVLEGLDIEYNTIELIAEPHHGARKNNPMWNPTLMRDVIRSEVWMYDNFYLKPRI